jgi:hypothetical protein
MYVNGRACAVQRDEFSLHAALKHDGAGDDLTGAELVSRSACALEHISSCRTLIRNPSRDNISSLLGVPGQARDEGDA